MLSVLFVTVLLFLQSVISWHHHRPPDRWTRLLSQKGSRDSGTSKSDRDAIDNALQSILNEDIYEDDEPSLRLSSLSGTFVELLKGNTYEDENDAAETMTPGAPLQQLQLRFNCDEVDSDDLSELLFEVGTLSVSVEVQSEKDILNDETRWMEVRDRRRDMVEFSLFFPHLYPVSYFFSFLVGQN